MQHSAKPAYRNSVGQSFFGNSIERVFQFWKDWDFRTRNEIPI